LEENILHARNFADSNFTEKELFGAFEGNLHGSVKRVKKGGNFAHIFFVNACVAKEALEKGLNFKGSDLILSYAKVQKPPKTVRK
jgi:hypothetical protein